MKKAIIISAFDNYSYNVRTKYIEKYLKQQGYSCKVLSSDFDHRNKQKYTADRESLELIHVPEYKKNLSFKRIYSHYCFAKNVFKRLIELKPDLIYGSTPPNFLFTYISKYKKINQTVGVVYEIGDLWPETLPLEKKFKIILSPVLNIWKMLRNKNIGYADAVVFECELFKRRIKRYCISTYSKTIYLSKEDYFKEKFSFDDRKDNMVVFAYIGAINNIIDINIIINILKEVSVKKKILFRIIGDGENKKQLLKLCKEFHINYEDYGIIYDEQKKYEILKDCQFAFNIMKNTVSVGLTMKSLEYFHWGLILINNIPADSACLVEKYKCGVNIKDNDIKAISEWICKCNKEKINEYRKNSREVYENNFSEKHVMKDYKLILDYIEEKRMIVY